MNLDPEKLEKLDPLALTNTITLSALIGLLVKKGILTHDEMTAEIQAMRARLGLESGGRDRA